MKQEETRVKRLASVPTGWTATAWLNRLKHYAKVVIHDGHREIYRAAAERLEKDRKKAGCRDGDRARKE
jgi:hypothetical protein